MSGKHVTHLTDKGNQDILDTTTNLLVAEETAIFGVLGALDDLQVNGKSIFTLIISYYLKINKFYFHFYADIYNGLRLELWRHKKEINIHIAYCILHIDSTYSGVVRSFK